MSIQSLLRPETKNEDWAKIYTHEIVTDIVTTDVINITGAAPSAVDNLTVSNDLTVDGSTNIGGNNYYTPDLGQPNYVLKTDGSGHCEWVNPTDGDVVYSGVAPTIPNQLSKISSVDGKSITQSLITDNGSELNLNNQNLTNVNNINSSYLTADSNGTTINDGINSILLPVNRGVPGSVLVSDGLGQTDWIISSYASMGFVDNFFGFNTDFTAKDEWVIINGSYQSDAVNNFTFQTNKFQYVGTSTKLFRVSAGASITKALSGTGYCEMAIFVNNVEQTRSKQVQSTSPGSVYPQHMGSDCLVQIANNQLVDVRIRNTIDAESFRVVDLSVVIAEV